MFRSRHLALVLLLALVALPGCLDIDNTYTLNPDGSGRVDVSMTFDLSGLPAEAIPEGEGVKDFARNLITQSTGIEVWSDLKAVKSQRGTIRVSGRGYFRDLSAVSLDGAYPIGFRIDAGQSARTLVSFDVPSDVTAIEGEGTGPAGDAGERRETVDGDSTSLVPRDRMVTEGSGGGTTGTLGADPTGIVPSETVDIVAGQLEELNILGPEKLARLRQRVTFIFPGSVDAVTSGFVRGGDNRASLLISGTRMLEVVDSVRNDPAFRRQYQNAKNFPWSRLLFGENMPGASFSPAAKPLFDYAREVAAATKRYPQLKRELGIR